MSCLHVITFWSFLLQKQHAYMCFKVSDIYIGFIFAQQGVSCFINVLFQCKHTRKESIFLILLSFMCVEQ